MIGGGEIRAVRVVYYLAKVVAAFCLMRRYFFLFCDTLLGKSFAGNGSPNDGLGIACVKTEMLI